MSSWGEGNGNSLPPRCDGSPMEDALSNASSSFDGRQQQTKRARVEEVQQASPVADCAEQFQVQGIRHEPCTDQLWCALCTTGKADWPALTAAQVDKQRGGETGRGSEDITADREERKAFPPIEEVLCIVGRTAKDVLAHCATRDHLLCFEKTRLSDLQHWCPVQLHGERMLLDQHCVYPTQMFGPGRMLMDETVAGGVLLGHDVCGGVKLWPRHRYSIVELVLPQARSFVDRVTLENTADTSTTTAEADEGGDAKGGVVVAEPATVATTVDVFYEEASAPPPPEVETRLRRSRRLCNMRTTGAQRLPSFYRKGYSVTTQRVQASDFAQVLKDVNGFILGEAQFRQVRTERFAKDNV